MKIYYRKCDENSKPEDWSKSSGIYVMAVIWLWVYIYNIFKLPVVVFFSRKIINYFVHWYGKCTYAWTGIFVTHEIVNVLPIVSRGRSIAFFWRRRFRPLLSSINEITSLSLYRRGERMLAKLKSLTEIGEPSPGLTINKSNSNKRSLYRSWLEKASSRNVTFDLRGTSSS